MTFITKVPRSFVSATLSAFILEALVVPLFLALVLRNTLKWADCDLKKLTNYVMNKANKVFLTLVRSEAVPGNLELFQSHGFTDADLPIGLNGENGNGICSVGLDGKPKNPNGQSLNLFDDLSDATIETFFQRQWIFLAPTFRKDQFEYKFDHHCSLPFVDLQDKHPHKGGFGAVRRLGLQIEYTDFLTFDKTDKNAKPYVEVAVKLLTSTPAVDVKKFYRKEMETLEVMRSLNDDHLIQAIAVYKKGNQKCFVFPWAKGGSLQDFWGKDRTKLSRGLVAWAIAQMYGISKAIGKLHGSSEKGIRHGDIKPLNILHFHESRNGSYWGTLVVADVGLAKLHQDYTDLREGTTTKHGTTMYEPPEMVNFAVNTTTISRKYDARIMAVAPRSEQYVSKDRLRKFCLTGCSRAQQNLMTCGETYQTTAGDVS
ncbi:hypothetical protein CGMCC3_g11146 [Colletotrichum fructicola]|nr:uncharacterized protein CGMCC3_g11146 [Colletotrichum fructicola]KAE9572707.1 hypothetical protein CGMCC3_g11146 [Colletotrichum fructicola]